MAFLDKGFSEVTEDNYTLTILYDPEYDADEIDCWQDDKGLHIGSTADEIRAAYGAPEDEELTKDLQKYLSGLGIDVDSCLIYSARGTNQYRLIFVLDQSDTVSAIVYEASALE